jgi:adenylate cyclase
MQPTRRLAAILFTDIVGSTAIMQKDEQAAVAINKRYVAVLKQFVTSHHGEILNDYGDGSLCVFHSATEALRCAVEMQQQLQTDIKVPLRIGLHIGEIFFEDGKVFGDGVNVASRIQSLGQANSILFSKEIFDKLRNQPEFKSVSLGFFEFKNVDEPMEIFALANNGLTVPEKKEMSGKLKDGAKKNTSKKWIIALASFIILILAFFIYETLISVKNFSGEDKTIAVLPFENVGVIDTEEYVSDGITQDIINNLSKVSSLKKVIGWFSVRGFKKTTKTLKQIADELGVTSILSGSIEKQKNKIHIITELIEVNTNKRLWGDDFEYESKDILSIQSQVAGEIVTVLKAKVTPEEKKNLSKHYTENVEAYKFYRKGRFFWDQRTKESFDSAEVYYKKAINLDPDYALAYSGLADIYIYPNSGLSQLEAMPIAREYADKALVLDSTLSEALTTLGFIQSAFDYDWAKSKITLEKAIALNPNYPTAHLYYGNLLQYTGISTERGIDEIEKALVLDPLSINLNYVLGRNYYGAQKYDSAYNQLKKTLALNPDFNLAKGNLACVLLAKKNYAEAFNIIKEIPETGSSKIFYYKGQLLSYAYALSGDKTHAKAELEKTTAAYPDQSSYQLARVYILLNNYDEAFARLEKAYETRDLWMYFLKVDPTYDPIRNEPKFKLLMKKMNLD